MKIAVYFSFIFLLAFSAQAQKIHDKDDEKIKSLKVAHITKSLDLTESEAAKFWVIYNKYEKKNDELYSSQWCDVKNGLETVENVDENTAKTLVEQYINIKKESAQLKAEFVKELEKVISYRKILALKKAENDFHRILIKQYKDDQTNN